MSPSLRRVCLHGSLFPKKRRGELAPGRRRRAATAAIIGKLPQTARNLLTDRRRNKGEENAAAICYESRCVVSPVRACVRAACVSVCVRAYVRTPAQHYVGTTMDRIIIGKSNVVKREGDG